MLHYFHRNRLEQLGGVKIEFQTIIIVISNIATIRPTCFKGLLTNKIVFMIISTQSNLKIKAVEFRTIFRLSLFYFVYCYCYYSI